MIERLAVKCVSAGIEVARMQSPGDRTDRVRWSGRKHASRKKRAFTLIELLVVIAIISLLVSILLPSLQKAKDIARKTICLSQVRGTGLALGMYQEEWDGYYPLASRSGSKNPWGLSGALWTATLYDAQYIDEIRALICPSHPPAGVSVAAADERLLLYLTYGMTGTYHTDGIDWNTSSDLDPHQPVNREDCWNPSISEIVTDSIIIPPAVSSWVYDDLGIGGAVQISAFSKHKGPDYNARVHFRHLDTASVLFMDSHAESAADDIEIVAWCVYEEYGTGPLWEFYAVEHD